MRVDFDYLEDMYGDEPKSERIKHKQVMRDEEGRPQGNLTNLTKFNQAVHNRAMRKLRGKDE